MSPSWLQSIRLCAGLRGQELKLVRGVKFELLHSVEMLGGQGESAQYLSASVGLVSESGLKALEPRFCFFRPPPSTHRHSTNVAAQLKVRS